MTEENKQSDLQSLPACAVEFIKQVLRKMRYRKKVRLDVQAELTAHFEDELKDLATDDEKAQKAQQLIAGFGDVKLLAVLLRRAKKRCRPLWRTVVARTFQTIGVLILCFVVYCVYISLGKPTISTNYVVEATRLARPVADESQNAAPLYQRAIEAYKQPPEIEREVTDYFYDMYEFEMPNQPNAVKRQPRIEKVSLLVAIEDEDWIGDLTQDKLSALKQWISNNSEAINFFKQASEKPHCWWQREAKDGFVINVLMPELRDMKTLVRLLCWRAKLQAFSGDAEKAFDDLLAGYRAGRHLKGPRSLVEQLVGMSVQLLSARTAIIILHNQQVNGELLKNFQVELKKLMAQDTFNADYKVESFLGLDFLQRCYTDNGKGSGHMIPSRLKELHGTMFTVEDFKNSVLDFSQFLGMALASADRGRMSREFEKVYNTPQQWAHKTPYQLRKENVDFEMGLDKWSSLKRLRYWPVMVLTPAIGKVIEITYRSKIEVEALITIISLLRYQRDNGQYPQNLDELITAGYLKQLPIDPYSDKPLVYKKTVDDFTLYTVGLNFEDDGGESGKDTKGRVRKWRSDGDTVFWPVGKLQLKQ